MRCAGRPPSLPRYGLSMSVPRPGAPHADLAMAAGSPPRSGRICGQFSFDSSEGGFFEIDPLLNYSSQPFLHTLGTMQLRQKSHHAARSAEAKARRARLFVRESVFPKPHRRQPGRSRSGKSPAQIGSGGLGSCAHTSDHATKQTASVSLRRGLAHIRIRLRATHTWSEPLRSARRGATLR